MLPPLLLGSIAETRRSPVANDAEEALGCAPRQAALVALTRQALTATDLSQLLDQAAELTAAALSVECGLVLKPLPGGESLLLTAGSGGIQGIGERTVSAAPGSLARLALETAEPVVIDDLRCETRFAVDPLFLEHGAVSVISAAIPGPERPFGLLSVYTTSPRTFSNEEAQLVQAMANTLALGVQRQQSERELRRSESSLLAAERIARLGHWEWHLTSGTIHWSDEIYRIFGLSPQEFRPSYEAFMERVHPDDRQRLEDAVEGALRRRGTSSVDHRIVLPDGSVRVVHQQGEVSFSEPGEPIRMLGTVQDITERMEAEQALRRANRALRTLGECSRALMAANDEEELLQEVCRIAVEVGGYRFAWIGFVERDEAHSIRPSAHAGHEAGYLSLIRVSWVDDEWGRGPVGTAIRTGEPYVVRNIQTDPRFSPWAEPASQRGYASVIALPLRLDGASSGALVIYAAETDAFEAEEQSLLQEVAADLSYGVSTLRTRAERARTEAELKATRERLLAAEVEKKQFTREVLSAVTHGKFHLVDAEEIPTEGELVVEIPLHDLQAYPAMRKQVAQIAGEAGMSEEDVSDFVLSVAEAATNAIKHGVGGRATVYRDPDRVIVRITDRGPGILPENLPATILRTGFSTKISLGVGYTLMLELVDCIWLSTGPEGTVVQLEKRIHPEEQGLDPLAAALARF
ncbi:MAG: GAF domain-containing protein [Armatimonadota bacterium]